MILIGEFDPNSAQKIPRDGKCSLAVFEVNTKGVKAFQIRRAIDLSTLRALFKRRSNIKVGATFKSAGRTFEIIHRRGQGEWWDIRDADEVIELSHSEVEKLLAEEAARKNECHVVTRRGENYTGKSYACTRYLPRV